MPAQRNLNVICLDKIKGGFFNTQLYIGMKKTIINVPILTAVQNGPFFRTWVNRRGIKAFFACQQGNVCVGEVSLNKEHGIVPRTIIKGVREVLEISKTAEGDTIRGRKKRKLNEQERAAEIAKLEKEMKEAAKMLEFEYAAVLRDRIIELKGEK